VSSTRPAARNAPLASKAGRAVRSIWGDRNTGTRRMDGVDRDRPEHPPERGDGRDRRAIDSLRGGERMALAWQLTLAAYRKRGIRVGSMRRDIVRVLRPKQ
jgi:hypothetical protein